MPLSPIEENAGGGDTSRLVLGTLLQLLVLCLGVAYAVIPLIYLNGVFCPAKTVMHGPVGSIAFFVFGAGIWIFSSSCLVAGITRRSNGTSTLRIKWLGTLNETNKRAFVAIMSCGMFFGGAELWDFSHAYYCLTSENVVLRLSDFQPIKSLDWDDVILVRGHCQTMKNSRAGWVALSFRNGDAIDVLLRDGDAGLRQQYESIRNLLRYSSYYYRRDPSVTVQTCPHEVYPLLYYWVEQIN